MYYNEGTGLLEKLASVMKIGIFSDTHDNIRSIAKAMDIFRLLNATTIIHCGDWVAPFALDTVGKLAYDRRVPVYGVLGNNVGDLENVFARNAALAQPIHLTKNEYLELPLATKKLVMQHGHNAEMLEHLTTQGTYDVVCTGHTHKPLIEKHGRTLLINPGATCFVIDGEPSDEASVAILDTQTMQATIHTYQWGDI